MIDVSGDGANNQGPPVTMIRDQVLGARASPSTACRSCSSGRCSPTWISKNLDIYYEDCVIGGAGAFVIPIQEREKFKEATRTKLVLEIAGRQPPSARHSGVGGRPRISCTDRRADVAISLGRTGL